MFKIDSFIFKYFLTSKTVLTKICLMVIHFYKACFKVLFFYTDSCLTFELLLFLTSNVNWRYLVILFNEIKVWAGIEACFATVKYSIYC
jgi:hypothetical protein